MVYDNEGSLAITRAEIEGLFPVLDEKDAPFVQIFDKITGIGDSLMAGYTALHNGTIISSATARERGANWLTYLGLELGRMPTNLAVGNTETHDWRYKERDADLETADIDTNLYIVALGVNDSRHGATIGSSADIKTTVSENADSYYGNLDWIVRTLHGYNDQAHVFLFTIPGSETKASDINTAVRYIANLYSYAHCIDLATLYGTEFQEGFIHDNLYSGHYNPITYRLIASYIGQAMNRYIYENYTLFRDAPYVL